MDLAALTRLVTEVGESVGAQAAGLDRQTDAASGAVCLLLPPAGRPLIVRSIDP